MAESITVSDPGASIQMPPPTPALSKWRDTSGVV